MTIGIAFAYSQGQVTITPGGPHQATQRGKRRMEVFFTDDDRCACLRLLREQAERCGVQVLGWRPMTNHVHLIVRPETEDARPPLAGGDGAG